MAKTVTEKIGIKESMRTIFINAPADTVDVINSTSLDLKNKLTGTFDYIHVFVHTQDEFHKMFPKLKRYLKQSGMLWVSWPKSLQIKA